ncbi:MAG: tRNA pseudouridine(55) synthase TruB [Candidatus Vecturithrix sp.]|nr:tRNA pseudouridine(55) synthase TruB [Candidatus Vecturithrix sp.]
MQGVLLINKSENITSSGVGRQVRQLFQTRKVGHAGTLDPFATGLLILCLEGATKIIRYLVEHPKEYVAVMKCGETTDTQDCTGVVLERRDIPAYTSEVVENVFSRFIGAIRQIPPMYSARRVQGKRLYQLARAGKTVEREAQTVTVSELEILEQALPYIRFRVVCSKGTYIRTLAHDLGEALGCGAHLTALVRTRIGHFSVQDAFSLDQLAQLTQRYEREACLISINQALSFLPAIELDDASSLRLAHGGRVAVPEGYAAMVPLPEAQKNPVRVLCRNGELIALARAVEHDLHGEIQWQLQPISVFAHVLEFAD